jgi:hypothetical protein
MVRVSPCRALEVRYLLNIAILKRDNIKIYYFIKSFLNDVILPNILRICANYKKILSYKLLSWVIYSIVKKKLYVKEMRRY